MSALASTAPAGALPIRITVRDERLVVDWLPLDTIAMPEPFFPQTIRRMRDDGAQYVTTGLDALAAFADSPVPVRTAFVFHVSHCGSTLVANVLKTIPESFVLSEPALITVGGQLCSPYLTRVISREQHHALIRGAIAAYAAAGGPKRYLFCKFTDVASLCLPLLRSLFPEVPFLFLYRDPRHVIASNLEIPEDIRRQWHAEVAALLGHEAHWAPPPARYFAEIFEAECVRAAITPNVIPLDYRDLSPERLLQLLPQLGVAPQDVDEAALRGQFRTYSKALPSQAERFSAQAEAARREAMAACLDPAHCAGALAAYERTGATAAVA